MIALIPTYMVNYYDSMKGNNKEHGGINIWRKQRRMKQKLLETSKVWFHNLQMFQRKVEQQSIDIKKDCIDINISITWI